MYMFSFRLVFPNGLSSEYSLVTTFRLRKTTKKDRWYLWQIFDQTGGTQVGLNVHYKDIHDVWMYSIELGLDLY